MVSTYWSYFVVYSREDDQFAKEELEEEHYRKQYRSNLSKIYGFLDKLTLKPAHIACLQRTPFYNFLEPFINKRVSSNYIKGTHKGLVEIGELQNEVLQLWIHIFVYQMSFGFELCMIYETWFCIYETY